MTHFSLSAIWEAQSHNEERADIITGQVRRDRLRHEVIGCIGHIDVGGAPAIRNYHIKGGSGGADTECAIQISSVANREL